jgi:hypothetical protein
LSRRWINGLVFADVGGEANGRHGQPPQSVVRFQLKPRQCLTSLFYARKRPAVNGAAGPCHRAAQGPRSTPRFVAGPSLPRRPLGTLVVEHGRPVIGRGLRGWPQLAAALSF